MGSIDWSSILAGLLFIAMAVVMIAYAALWPLWVMTTTPASDAPRIKRDLEIKGRRVLAVQRQGTTLGSRSTPHYRKYEITLRRPDGADGQFHVGVSATLSGNSTVVLYDEKRLKDFLRNTQEPFLPG